MKLKTDWLIEFVVLALWFWFLSWITSDVPKPWHTPIVFGIFYLSRISTCIGALKKTALEILGD